MVSKVENSSSETNCDFSTTKKRHQASRYTFITSVRETKQTQTKRGKKYTYKRLFVYLLQGIRKLNLKNRERVEVTIKKLKGE